LIDWTRLDPPPVGVRVLGSAQEATGVPVYRGVSYCDAIRRAGEGQALRVLPGSIQVCHWTPVVLGLKDPENRFERGLAPRLAFPVAGLLLAPLDRFPGEPEVVVVRASPEALREMSQLLGPEHLWADHQGKVVWSAVPFLTGDGPSFHYRFVNGVNAALAALTRPARLRALTYRLFQDHLVTAAYDVLISHLLVDMSICRNSTIIPRLTGCVNASFFCSGGIAWGGNRPDHMTSGWPWPLWQRLTQGTGEGHG